MMHRILVIDDNPAIHNDIRKILARPEPGSTSLEDAETLLFGEAVEEDKRIFKREAGWLLLDLGYEKDLDW